jgi:hypothetical protein
MNLTTANLKFSGGFNQSTTYWMNNLYSDTSFQIQGSELANFSVTLPAYGSAIYTISTVEENVSLPPIPTIVSVDDEISIQPKEYSLFQNYPNPFNPSTVIRYTVPNVTLGGVEGSRVILKIYDVLGREIKTLVNQEQTSGVYEVIWNGDNELGNKVSTGVYFYRIDAGDFVQTKKMMLIK